MGLHCIKWFKIHSRMSLMSRRSHVQILLYTRGSDKTSFVNYAISIGSVLSDGCLIRLYISE